MSIETLIIKQARLSDLRRDLKSEGCEESSKCTRLIRGDLNGFDFISGDSCIAEVYSCWRDDCAEAAFNHCSGPHFEEVWIISVDEGDVCQHCQKVRELKKQRVQAGRELGGVRAAITRVGRRLAKEAAA